MHVAFLIPTTSKGKGWKKFSDSFLSSILIPSLNEQHIDVTLFIGIDRDDIFYNDNDVLIDLSRQIQAKNLNLKLVKFEAVKKGHLTQMWNILFDEALKDSTIEYFFQCGDDIFFHTNGWIDDAISKLKSNDDIGACAPIDVQSPKLLTNIVVSRKHKELLSYFFPPEILNWHCDDWINHVYGLRGHLFRLYNHHIENCGGLERYTPVFDKELTYFKYVERDIEKIPINSTKNMTIVSGFINIQNTSCPRSLNEYVDLGKRLLRLPLHKVVFIDETILYKFDEHVNEDTKIVPFKLSDLWLTPYLKDIEHTEKDTYTVILQKTDWMKRAMYYNPFSSNVFGWVNFDIFNFSQDDKFFTRHILNAISCEKNITKSRITAPGWWDINNHTKMGVIPVYKNPLWFFCGYLFFGYKKVIKTFDLLFKKEVLNALSQNKITFDVNLWFKIYRENPELFKWYGADNNNKYTVFSELVNIQPKDKVGIVLTTFNRPEYLVKTLQSLKDSRLNSKLPFDVELVIIDDCSDNQETKKIIGDFNLEHTKVVKLVKTRNSGVFNSLRQGWEYLLAQGCVMLTNLDSDAIVKKDFIVKLKDAFDSLSFDILTGYNSRLHKTLTYKTLSGGDSVVLKKSLGGINMVFSPRTYKELVEPCLLDRKFDWYVSACCDRILALTPSVIQHIGRNGMNNSENNEDFDYSEDFILDD